MARIYEELDEYQHGRLVVEEISSDRVEVFYVPPPRKLEDSGLNAQSGSGHRVKLLEFDGISQCITIFPTNTHAGRDDFLQPKYDKVRRITLAGRDVVVFLGDDDELSDERDPGFLSPYSGPTVPLEDGTIDIESFDLVPSTEKDVMRVLEGLPSAFIKDYDYGLGLAKPYRFIVDAVEKLTDCTEIVISNEHETAINKDEGIFYISLDDFETARKILNSTTQISRIAARSVKDASVHNLLAERIGKPKVPVAVGRHPLRKLFTSAAQGQAPLSDDEQAAVVRAFEKNVNAIAETEPGKLAKLQHDIELVTLETLIVRFEAMITGKLSEKRWQDFFNENPFILTLAFGYPIIKVKDQAFVSGHDISGTGSKIADFVVKNSMTDNTAIVEIKTPQKLLLNMKPYRPDVYTPSSELSGSINQVLDQKYWFEREIAHVKEKSGMHDIETYSVHCCLIIGRVPTETERKKSFELYRRNSKDVEIVTFDELLAKLKELLRLLKPDQEMAPTQRIVDDSDLPF